MPDVEEREDGAPEEVALENAVRKARAVSGDLVLGVDTVVALDGRIYGKPASADEARLTLRALSGQPHTVVGGVCLLDGAAELTAVALTTVHFRSLDETLIDWYVHSGEWRERAGAYAIQGRGAALIGAIEGDYFNVVGLPVAELLRLAPGLLDSQ